MTLAVLSHGQSLPQTSHCHTLRPPEKEREMAGGWLLQIISDEPQSGHPINMVAEVLPDKVTQWGRFFVRITTTEVNVLAELCLVWSTCEGFVLVRERSNIVA